VGTSVGFSIILPLLLVSYVFDGSIFILVRFFTYTGRGGHQVVFLRNPCHLFSSAMLSTAAYSFWWDSLQILSEVGTSVVFCMILSFSRLVMFSVGSISILVRSFSDSGAGLYFCVVTHTSPRQQRFRRQHIHSGSSFLCGYCQRWAPGCIFA
jgi:hypothetical protein